MSLKLLNKVKKALEIDNSIVVTRDETLTHKGFTTEYLETLGLSKQDLKQLANKGLALRGYTKNEWVEGETPPGHKPVPKGMVFHSTGHRCTWLLLADLGGEDAKDPL